MNKKNVIFFNSIFVNFLNLFKIEFKICLQPKKRSKDPASSRKGTGYF